MFCHIWQSTSGRCWPHSGLVVGFLQRDEDGVRSVAIETRRVRLLRNTHKTKWHVVTMDQGNEQHLELQCCTFLICSLINMLATARPPWIGSSQRFSPHDHQVLFWGKLSLQNTGWSCWPYGAWNYSSIHFLLLIWRRVVRETGPRGKPRHRSAQRHSPAPPGGPRGVPRPDGIYNPSSGFWFCPGASSQEAS